MKGGSEETPEKVGFKLRDEGWLGRAEKEPLGVSSLQGGASQRLAAGQEGAGAC